MLWLGYPAMARGRWMQHHAVAGKAASSISSLVGHFALAGLAWLAGPVSLVIAGAGVAAMLVWRQTRSPAARACRQALALMEHVHERSS